jgi:hypothetical protein
VAASGSASTVRLRSIGFMDAMVEVVSVTNLCESTILVKDPWPCGKGQRKIGVLSR